MDIQFNLWTVSILALISLEGPFKDVYRFQGGYSRDISNPLEDHGFLMRYDGDLVFEMERTRPIYLRTIIRSPQEAVQGVKDRVWNRTYYAIQVKYDYS